VRRFHRCDCTLHHCRGRDEYNDFTAAIMRCAEIMSDEPAFFPKLYLADSGENLTIVDLCSDNGRCLSRQKEATLIDGKLAQGVESVYTRGQALIDEKTDLIMTRGNVCA